MHYKTIYKELCGKIEDDYQAAYECVMLNRLDGICDIYRKYCGIQTSLRHELDDLKVSFDESLDHFAHLTWLLKDVDDLVEHLDRSIDCMDDPC